MPFLLLLISFLFVIKVLSLLSVHSDFVWITKIVVNEMGHFISLAMLLIFVALLFLRRRQKISHVKLFCPLVIAIIYAHPLVTALLKQGEYGAELEKSFGPHPADQAFGINFLDLLKVETTEISFLSKLSYEPKEEIYFESADKTRKLKIFDFHANNKQKSTVPAPWVLVVHGGGWDAGNPMQLSLLNYKLEKKGFAVFAPEYALAPKFTWPTPVEDIEHAANWIKENAQRLGVDPQRGFLIGRSAGGQIALSVCYSGHIPEIKACVAFYAPTDMEVAYLRSSPTDFFRPIPRILAFLGGLPDEKKEAYALASPLRFVSAKTPPTLILHGTPDFWVWIGHSKSLIEKLKTEGVPSALLEFPWATHGFDVNLSGPAGQLSTQAVEWFLQNEANKN
jgi:acetyl esterase/lipase